MHNTPASSGAPLMAILANGRSGAFEESRARALSGSLPSEAVAILLRERGTLGTWRQWRQELEGLKPQALYSINTALPAVPFALMWARRHRVPFILDTGDLVYEMARRSGVEPMWRWPLLLAGEQYAWRASRTLVVRSSCFQDYLAGRGFRRVEVIRDGYHPGPAPQEAQVRELRSAFGLDGSFVLGVMGSLVWSPRLRICYGWDLVRALALLKDQPVRGVIIGDGDGRPRLEQLARELGVRDRLTFTGRVPYDKVPLYLRVMDVALSTQTNNLAGQVRTTGKLPEYMAAGRFILASDVGEATRILPRAMLLRYQGEVDESYPGLLATRVEELRAAKDGLQLAAGMLAAVEALCSEGVLRSRFEAVVRDAITARR